MTEPRLISIAPPNSMTVLAARHLDATEGPVKAGRYITPEDRSAIDQVLRYISHAHNAPTADTETAIAELAQAIRLTREYVGEELLPPVEGWSWYDALHRWAPDLLDAMLRPKEVLEAAGTPATPAADTTDAEQRDSVCACGTSPDPGICKATATELPKCDCMMRSDHTLKCASGLSTGVRRVNRLGELIDETPLTAEEWCGQKAGAVPHPPHRYMRNRAVYQCLGDPRVIRIGREELGLPPRDQDTAAAPGTPPSGPAGASIADTGHVERLEITNRALKTAITEAVERAEQAEHRLRLAHQTRRAKEHQLDGIRRALCDIGFMQDDDPYSHADLEDVIRQNTPDTAAAGWTPPPPGDTREQLPAEFLALLDGWISPYRSTACETAASCERARKEHPHMASLHWEATRLHSRCRLNQKFTGQICSCRCHGEQHEEQSGPA